MEVQENYSALNSILQMSKGIYEKGVKLMTPQVTPNRLSCDPLSDQAYMRIVMTELCELILTHLFDFDSPTWY